MKNRFPKYIYIIAILIILNVLFIWINSVLPKSDSRLESGIIRQLITPFLEIFVGQGNVTDHLVRKLAHFSEFFSLGFLSCLLLILLKKKPVVYICISSIFCLLVASIDETIQIFSNRGPQIQDVCLDFCSSLSAIIIVSLIFFIIEKIQQKSSYSK